MALKNEFDHRSYWIVLIRALTGAILGTVPGVIYVLSVGGSQAAQLLAWDLIQLGSIIGTLSFGLAALAATIVAAQKSRGTGPKPARLKDYTHPNPLPPIPAASKPESKQGTKESEVIVVPFETPLGDHLQAQVDERNPGTKAEPPGFEDFDRSPD